MKEKLPEPEIMSPGLRTLLHSFACGGLSGGLAAFVTCPMDVIKTLRQRHDMMACLGA